MGTAIPKRIFNFIFEKIFRINDTPQRIAVGFALGVFAGIIPGTGPIAAFFLAFIFKVNRAAALAGSLLTNTWLALVTFILAIKLGSVILNLDWQNVLGNYNLLINDFSFWKFAQSFIEIVFPVIIGYFIIGLILGIFSYFLTLLIINRRPHGTKTGY